MNHEKLDGFHSGLRSLLLDLARREDDLAAREAARTPYWAPYPDSVIGRRSAAAVLRAEADELMARDAS
jgi:hypothetical protein